MLTAFTLLLKLRKYWPLISLVLALLRDNSGRLDDLIARPETEAGEDARDFFREAEDDEFWDRMGDIG